MYLLLFTYTILFLVVFQISWIFLYIHDNVLYYLKFKLNIFRHVFTKLFSAVTNLVNCFDFLVSY
jgi:hypothetical protein